MTQLSPKFGQGSSQPELFIDRELARVAEMENPERRNEVFNHSVGGDLVKFLYDIVHHGLVESALRFARPSNDTGVEGEFSLVNHLPTANESAYEPYNTQTFRFNPNDRSIMLVLKNARHGLKISDEGIELYTASATEPVVKLNSDVFKLLASEASGFLFSLGIARLKFYQAWLNGVANQFGPPLECESPTRDAGFAPGSCS